MGPGHNYGRQIDDQPAVQTQLGHSTAVINSTKLGSIMGPTCTSCRRVQVGQN